MVSHFLVNSLSGLIDLVVALISIHLILTLNMTKSITNKRLFRLDNLKNTTRRYMSDTRCVMLRSFRNPIPIHRKPNQICPVHIFSVLRPFGVRTFAKLIGLYLAHLLIDWMCGDFGLVVRK